MLRPNGASVSPLELGARQRLRLLHVRLIERVHTQADAQLPCRILPGDERRTQAERVGREVGDDLAIGIRRGDGVVDHGNDAPSALPRALGDQLLDPVGEPRHRRRRPQHQLVPPGERRRGDTRAQRPRCRRVDRERPLEQDATVEPGERGGQHPHDRQRGIPSPHVRGMRKHRTEATLACQGLERAPGVGDRHESPRLRARRQIPIERERLDRAPRFARDHEQRAVEVGCARHGQHRGRVRAVEYRQAELPEARREHQRREARAPHPAHDGARQPVAPRHVGKAGEVVPLRQRRAGRVFPSQEVHTAAKHNEPSRPSGPAVRLARRPPVPPLSRLTRMLVAIAAASFLAIVLAYLRTPADRAGRTLAAAALIGVAVAIIGVWFTHSFRANRRYAALLENEVASQTRSLMDSLAATAAAERNLRLVMDAVPDAIVVVDRAATILEANEPARGMGAIPGTTQRPSLFDVVNPDAIGVVQEKLGAAFEGDVQHLEVPLIRADSSHGIAALLYAPVRDGSKITRVLILARDVTDQRRSESQYQQAEKLAALGQLVSGVAHEINNPAAIISGFAQPLLPGELKPEHRDMLQMMYDEATRIGRITSSLLAFARAGGKQRGLVDLNDIARRTFALRSYYLSTLNITVALDLDPSEPKIWADASELQQMLLNLLINAEQALLTVERARTITVRTRADESDTRLEIADSGPGIPAELRTRILDPFFTAKPDGVGTGLGLSSICCSSEASAQIL